MSQKSKNTVILLVVAAGAITGICLMCVLAVIFYTRDSTQVTDLQQTPRKMVVFATNTPVPLAPEPTATTQPTATPTMNQPTPTDTPAPTPTPASPEEQIKAIVLKAVGESNRSVERISHVSILVDTITIRWSINDNFSEDMIKTGAKINITDMLKAIDEAGIEYGLINFEGTFSLVDNLGNVSEETVVWATYDFATVSQINWPNFLHENIYDIATTSKLHPIFAE